MKEEFPKSEASREEYERNEQVSDTPKKLGEIPMGMYPMTPRANDWLVEHNIYIWDYDDLRLMLIKTAEDQGKQLTRSQMEELKGRIAQTIEREKGHQEKIKELGSGEKIRDKIVGVEVFHAPVYSNQHAVRIIAVTEKGFRVTLRNVYGGWTDRDILKTRKLAEEFGKTLVGREFEFRKVSHELVGERGKRIRLQTMVSKSNLPELKDLDLQKWAEGRQSMSL